ncbi:MAG: energy-coupling factor transporter transmembrane protein EcfT [Oscillospiraceae bacterium]|nr:energy-coupling factor transporter transmembrane protein EcfT [Oscillospiraceae bacterium]
MRQFSDYNPAAVAVWFFSVTGIAMFCSYPPLTVITALGGILFYLLGAGFSHGKTHLFFGMLFLVLALANPVISHNGVTVLFVLNHNPVTLEALLYGINSAAMIVGVLYWFRSFTRIMTSEKLLYLTGMLTPKLSLVLSMALRFVPLLRRQSEKIHDSQLALGLYREDNMPDLIKGKMREFSILITWALENGITTADSMTARGYGIRHRSTYRRFRFQAGDILLLGVTAVLLGICAYVIHRGAFAFAFYPAVTMQPPGYLTVCGLLSYAVLVLLPFGIEMEVGIRWRSLLSHM